MNSGRKECTFFWFIENYSYCSHKKGERLISPPFTADGMEGTAWYICVFLRGERDEDRGYISLYFGRSASDDGPLDFDKHDNIDLNFLPINNSAGEAKSGERDIL
ncbi:hypothetical protein AVEN_176986-1 [Araneus ventricosus]|uniref:MATH domain-containing protein n=1 Tax=Araneus ventricosus TaxID=182803 RepID=A0A4Y2PF00_ARAVE|nr:hypothetical protein AVEN_176986-1 [Araneus ventricosus]